MNDLELHRKANIKRNKEHLDQLGILYKAPPVSLQIPYKKPLAKKRKLEPLLPSRSSGRIASAPEKPSYYENAGDEIEAPRKRASKANQKTSQNKVQEAASTAVVPRKDFESLRAGWTSWKPTGPSAIRDDEMTFHFKDQPIFTPNKSPEEMLREGCFGGSYFRPLYSRVLGSTIADDYLELPPLWIAGLDIDTVVASADYDPEVNKYKVKCGQSIEEWEAAGWIDHNHDVRGWFQWYCRFFMGRRCDDDERQISRWKKCVGDTGRWRRMLLKKYKAMGVKEVFDDGEDEEQDDVSPVMHQTCFHWAYEIRQGDLERYWRTEM